MAMQEARHVDPKTSSSGLDFKLHPLVLINISDHHTRVQANSTSGPSRVLGCLLGQQNGRVVEIVNSFEMLYDLQGTSYQVNEAFLAKKQEQYKQVFPDQDVVGWYATGPEIDAGDMDLHRKVQEINESPVFLLMDTTPSSTRRDLPLSLFEMESHVIEGVLTPIFCQSSYSIETSEAERIGVDQVAKILPSDQSKGSDQLNAHLLGVGHAMKMMNSRIAALLELMQKMSSGELPMDHGLLRQISSLVNRLPTIKGASFQKEYLLEYNDALLTVLLTSITKGTYAANEIVDKFNLAYEKTGRRRGGGLML